MRALAVFLTLSLTMSGMTFPLYAQQALVGATIIHVANGDDIEDGVILVKGDRITCAGEKLDCPIAEGTDVVDLAGSFVTPGLVDTHVHFGQTGWVAGRWENLPELYPVKRIHAELRANPARWHHAYLCSGVTAAFDVGGSPWTVTETEGRDLGRPNRTHVRSAGPMMMWWENDADRFLPMKSEQQIRTGIARLVKLGSTALKVLYPEPPAKEREAADAMLQVAGNAAHDAGLPMIVHATELRSAKVALRAGAKMLVHSVWDKLVDQEFLDLLAKNDAWYTPTMVVNFNWMKSSGTIYSGVPAEIDDPNHCVDEAMLSWFGQVKAVRAEIGDENLPSLQRGLQGAFNSGKRWAYSELNLQAVRNAGGRIVLGSDAGNSLTVHGPSVNWEMEAMEAAGLSPREVIHAATIEGANAMGMAEQIGSLQEGKVADLLVLAQDPRITVRNFRSLSHVMRAGVLMSQSELQVR